MFEDFTYLGESMFGEENQQKATHQNSEDSMQAMKRDRV